MGPRRQHDDRHSTLTTDLVQQSETIDLRQHDIEDDQIVLALQRAGKAVTAVVNGCHPVAILREKLLHHAA
jgi:hypothetical protein